MVTCLVGGSFGSEGKGLLVGHIAKDFPVHVRVGAANAGHTVYVDGQKHVLQQLPCAAYANPAAKLVLGAGAMISPEILMDEIAANVGWRNKNKRLPLRLYIDHRAHVIRHRHIRAEQETDLAIRIGSTSTIAKEGIGAAQAARVMRTGYRTIQEAIDKGLFSWPGIAEVEVTDTVKLLHTSLLFDGKVLLEGTQGAGLDNSLGFYPFVTSRHTTSSGLAADCGIGPNQIKDVIVVARTYPIRVAGNSGPFWDDSTEIEWSDIGIDPNKERTTVTKKIRRVATFSMEQMVHAARVNGATKIALTFADYLNHQLNDVNTTMSRRRILEFDYIGPMIKKIEDITDVPVAYVGTGPQTVINILG